MSADLTELAARAIELARELLRAAEAAKTRNDERQAKLMAEMLDRPENLAFTLRLADQVFRPKSPHRVAELLSNLVGRYGLPTYLSPAERAAFSVGVAASRRAAQLTIPAIRGQVRAQSSDLILDAADRPFTAYLERSARGGLSVNVNLLGEAVLGDREAEARMEHNLRLIARPDVNHVSVKISSIVGRIRPWAFDDSLDVICGQLRRLYRASKAKNPPTFINLDMEAYEDLELTLQAFMGVLNEEEFLDTYAGIVLQAYLPDSHAAQAELTEWAVRRRRRGGAPIRVRLVKGANLGMEGVVAELNGWTPAPYPTKHDTDASFKRMVLYGTDPQRAEAVRLGIGSHNLFDVAFAQVLAEEAGVADHVEFEMLQGMAPHQARAVREATGRMLLYAPVVHDENFVSAVAYLARRLEENTDNENYLRHVFSIAPQGPVFDGEAGKFRAALEAASSVDSGRGRQPIHPGPGRLHAPNTDFTDPAARARLHEGLDRWRHVTFETIPLVIGGQRADSNETEPGFDPSEPDRESYWYSVASAGQVEQALGTARQAQVMWARRSVADRREVLQAAAASLEEGRFDLIGCMVRDGGKRAVEADVEVSEAVDMANYYASAFDDLDAGACSLEPFGVVAVVPPWNFPVAIPAGGVLASLMAGNAVILKPAPQAVLCSWTLAKLLWDAGIPRDVLQFVPTRDDDVGRKLVTEADAVILTGAYETGRLFTSWKPDMNLFAETSGKNSLTIMATADLDQAIADLVESAFGHAGQKCSAASLALVEGEIYDSPDFRRQLKDAVESLSVGSAWDVANDVTPLIGPPGAALERALSTLDQGEAWLVEPTRVVGAWSPGVRLGVQVSSFFHTTECFGPVLGVMRVDSLEEAIDVSNSSEFGLTGGLHSLDDGEISHWIDRIEVGNAYVNRTTTGAVVRRQPFGGWKRSVFGPGAKAGGPNYVLQLGTWHSDGNVDSATTATDAVRDHVMVAVDPSALKSESNLFRYRSVAQIVIRVTTPTDDIDLARAVADAVCGELGGPRPVVSVPPELADRWPGTVPEDDHAFVDRVGATPFARIRYLGSPSGELWRAARSSHAQIIDDPVVSNGRLELRHYVREQSVTRTLHRHGMILDESAAG